MRRGSRYRRERVKDKSLTGEGTGGEGNRRGVDVGNLVTIMDPRHLGDV